MSHKYRYQTGTRSGYRPAKDELRAFAAIGMFAPVAVAAHIAIAIFALIFIK